MVAVDRHTEVLPYERLISFHPRAVQSKEICEESKNTQITPVHMGLALLDQTATEGFTSRALTKIGADSGRLATALRAKAATLPKQDPAPDNVGVDSALSKVFKAADALRKKGGDSHIAIDHLLAGLITDATIAKCFSDAGVNTPALLEALKESRGGRKVRYSQRYV